MPTQETGTKGPQAPPIVDILRMEDSHARNAALKARNEYERRQVIRDPHAFSAEDIPHLTDARLVALVAKGRITQDQYIDEMANRYKIMYPDKKDKLIKNHLTRDLPIAIKAYTYQQAVNAALDRRQRGVPLTTEEEELLRGEKKLLDALDAELDEQGSANEPLLKSKLSGIIESAKAGSLDQEALISFIKSAQPMELDVLRDESIITPDQYREEQQRRLELSRNKASAPSPSPLNQSGQSDLLDYLLESYTGVSVERRNLAPLEAEKWIRTHVPKEQQRGLLTELKNFRDEGNYYSVTIGRDSRGYRLVRFQTPNPWNNVKKDAAQSIAREVRRETGKQINRLTNPDYSHNELLQQYSLVRQALPEGTATRQALDKVDGAVKIALATAGITTEAANLLVNAIRGALLEAPELKYKIAALLPDDVVRQGYVVAARSAGNTLRRYIHEKYHLPDRPKQTPVLVNTLDQIKPEHYRAQDAQKVGVDMRDLSREKAREFILKNVPLEKQASALETIDRLPGNTFGVQIMDAGWVRISASDREQRTYDNRPRYGSYDARK